MSKTLRFRQYSEPKTYSEFLILGIVLFLFFVKPKKTLRVRRVENLVLGGGVTGLSTGFFLKKKTEDFIVLEKNSRIGGKILTRKTEKHLFDQGANTFRPLFPATCEILYELGLFKNLLKVEDELPRFVYSGGLRRLPVSLKSLLFSDTISLKTKFSLLLSFVEYFKDPKKEETVEEFTLRCFGREIYDKIVQPFCVGVYGGDGGRLSAEILRQKRYLDDDGAEEEAKKEFALKKTTSASFKAGMGELTEALYQKIESKVFLNEYVKRVEKIGERFEIETNRQKISAKNIISTLPHHELRRILGISGKKVLYEAISTITLGFKNFSFPGFGELHPATENMETLGFLYPSETFPNYRSRDFLIHSLISGNCDEETSYKKTEKDLLKTLNLKNGEIIGHKIWKRGIPQFEIGHERGMQNLKQEVKKKMGVNFFIGGNFFHGIAVQDCIENGKSLAKEV